MATPRPRKPLSRTAIPGAARGAASLPPGPEGSPGWMRSAVLAIFFLSGTSGLVYQVIWVRQFANVFGNTVHSASLVTGVFMAGLGAGGYLLGRAGDRRFRDDARQPLRMYARAELLIAACGLALALGLPRLGALSAAVSSYARGAHGWYELSAASHALRYAVAVVLIAPPTFLMGGTLTLLIRFLVATDLRAATVRIGLLYGANTAGAALGALLTDFALVPALGIFATQLVAVGLNVGAGLFALALARRSPRGGALALEPEPVSKSLAASGTYPAALPAGAYGAAERGAVRATAVALALSGFAAMGLEILWFRILSGLLGAYRGVFSLLLAVILTGLWLGAFAGAWLHRRFGRPALLLLGAQCLLAATTLALLAVLGDKASAHAYAEGLKAAFPGAPAWARAVLLLWTNARPIVLALGLPAVLMGMSFPLANANVQHTEAAVGGRAGLLYLATTTGNVAGCALVGFVLLPALGSQRCAWLLALCAAASALPLYRCARRERAPREADLALGVLGAVAAVALAAFAALPAGRLLRGSVPFDDDDGTRRVLTVSEGLNETLAVIEMPGSRQLFTDGHAMSSTRPTAERYMRAFAHVPLLQLDAPERVLVVCFGIGNTLHAASLHPSVERLEVADLSRAIFEHAGWFSSANGDVLADPRVSVFINDGRHHLVMQPERAYDLITLEPPPIGFAGVAALYSREFYQLARSRLREGGYLTQWLPAYEVRDRAARGAVRAFVDVFPESVLLSGDDGQLILMGVRGPSIQFDADRVAERLRVLPAVRADLEAIHLADLKELAGMFAADRATMAAAVAGVDAVTDDRPSLEYSIGARLGERRVPADLFDVTHLDAWCPGCLARIPGLDEYLRVRGLVYASDGFLEGDGDHRRAPRFPWTTPLRVAVANSAYLRLLFAGPAGPEKLAGIEDLQAGRAAQAVAVLRRAVFEDPTDPEALEWLGRAYAAAGDQAAAAKALERAARLPRELAPGGPSPR